MHLVKRARLVQRLDTLDGLCHHDDSLEAHSSHDDVLTEIWIHRQRYPGCRKPRRRTLEERDNCSFTPSWMWLWPARLCTPEGYRSSGAAPAAGAAAPAEQKAATLKGELGLWKQKADEALQRLEVLQATASFAQDGKCWSLNFKRPE
ncbi:hypothetical protein CgunFtcFv8_018200 [Champsocephalus gunnari]|uniref:Uncharacterized protein n=1 Tax=Champsocephalus gunnari TaxID=52237 RepID=A0AAN8DMS0_CHAGU|nr:hypothetical protein CgunFtcFv8_018200 [Champsocephalus gunnari]